MMLHRFDPFFETRPPTGRHVLGADVYRRGETYYVEIDVPGVDLEDIDIEMEKKHLTVTVQRRELVDEDRVDISRGRPTGSFVRRFFLGDGLDGESIEAVYDKGVLTLSIPMTETAKARKIAITAASESSES
jgi:HSP20 family protein